MIISGLCAILLIVRTAFEDRTFESGSKAPNLLLNFTACPTCQKGDAHETAKKDFSYCIDSFNSV